jgi:hypothetical protein
MDAQLHRERIGRTPHPAAWDTLPDGVFVVTDSGPAVIVGGHLAVWDRQANLYRRWLVRPVDGTAMVLTPPSIVRVLRAGYLAQIDDSAR